MTACACGDCPACLARLDAQYEVNRAAQKEHIEQRNAKLVLSLLEHVQVKVGALVDPRDRVAVHRSLVEALIENTPARTPCLSCEGWGCRRCLEVRT